MKRLEDLSGQRFGKLVVESQEVCELNGKRQSICHCVCDCGNRADVPTFRLKAGGQKSCGCLKVIGDISGKRFGRLVAVELRGKNDKGEMTWFCKCDCGGEKIVSASQLKSGLVSSCGCLNREKMSNFGSQSLKGSAAAHTEEANKKRVKAMFGDSGSEARKEVGRKLKKGLEEQYIRVDKANIQMIIMTEPKGTNPYRGVSWDKRKNSWKAYCQVNGIKWEKKGFKTPEEAKEARDKKQAELIELAGIEDSIEERKKRTGK